MGSFKALAINEKLPTADRTAFGVKCERFFFSVVGPLVTERGLTARHRLLLGFGGAVPYGSEGQERYGDPLPVHLLPAPTGTARAETEL